MSFRIRLFVSVILSVGFVLGIVLATAWVHVLDLESIRLHNGLCSEAARVAREDFSARELRNLETDIARKLRLVASAFVLVQQTGAQGRSSYQSEQWGNTVPDAIAGWKQLPEATLAQAPEPKQVPESSQSAPPSPRCEVASFAGADGEWVIARATEADAQGQVAANREASRTEIKSVFLDVVRAVLPLALLLSGMAAWTLSASLIQPVQRLRASMRSVTPADLGARLEGSGEDLEFRELIASYNTMLERLERSFHQASRFSADAAHELKTPLTVLRGKIESLRRKTLNTDVHAELSELMDEVSRLTAITRKLLLLSQADAGKLELQNEMVDVTRLLQELAGDAQMACENIAIHFDIAESLQTQGDFLLLRQMFNNLIGNAIRYAPEYGQVSVTARVEGRAVAVRIANTSPPISQATRARFFERFYRGDDVQSRGLEGSGLGLCLALEIARAHHGTLVLMPSKDTEVLMAVKLPAK